MTTSGSSLDSLPLATSANLALERFAQLSGIKGKSFTGAELLYERAAILGYASRAEFSAGGSCHLIRCRDAVLAVNLPRDSDWELIPAWLGPWLDDANIAHGNWSALAYHCQRIAACDLLGQAHCLGLAVALASDLPPPPSHPANHQQFRLQHKTTTTLLRDAPFVVDLSSLWAGPLCSHLLHQAGCRVIKVEGLNRLDGARTGFPGCYQLLNQGKESVALDFRSDADMQQLKKLIAHADIIIEASRPRALRNMGIYAEQWVQSQPGRVWLSITGYGRDSVNGERIGFGDDAGAAAGLSHIMYEATGKYQFVGDAIADPLTGMHAALLAWQSLMAGGNELISISLRDTVSWCLHQELNTSRRNVLESCRRWQQLGGGISRLFPSGLRTPSAACATPGQHNETIFKELDSVAGAFH